MAHEVFEFYCSGGCRGYFRTRMRTSIDGDYIIVCPSCNHEHHRQIRNGQITGDRHNIGKGAERIIVPKSAFSKKPVMEHPEQGKDGYDVAVLVDGQTKRNLLWGRFSGNQGSWLGKVADKVKSVARRRKK